VLIENLRAELTWSDALVGCCAVAILSAVLIGFRHQNVPDYKLGQIANQDVRAAQTFIYEDAAATTLKRSVAESEYPALYQLESDLISEREKAFSAAFSKARDILAENSITIRTEMTPALEHELLENLKANVGRMFPPRILVVLLHLRFNPLVEERMLRALDRVLRDGIIEDRRKFFKDQRTGIVVRDSSFPYEHSLADSTLARDMEGARERLSQFKLDFSDLSPRDQAAIMQYLEGSIFPTLLRNDPETEARRAQAAKRVAPVEVQVRQGQTIIRNGEQVTSTALLQLTALRNLKEPRSLILQFFGCFILTTILIYSIWRYFIFYQTRHHKIRNHMMLMLMIIASELLIIRLLTALADILGERFQRFHDPMILYYGIPFAFGALLTTLLVDVNLGIIASIVLSLLAGIFYGDTHLSAYLVIGSIAGIYSIRQYKDRAAIVKAGLTIGIVNGICLTGLAIIGQTPMNQSGAIDQLVLALLSGFLAAALASLLLPGFETLFKIVTDIRLLELSNLNAPILRRLSVEAPGTYHHSLMVASLAEAAAEAIGANPLLARVAAYYHDIGKIANPDFFVENQSYGGNKHEELSPHASSSIIATHVNEGLNLARQVGLPQKISDMIPQHHGTRIMSYFYQKAKENLAEIEKVIEGDFRYPGPKPQSKEAAIMMMADSVEAASRTLTDPSPAQILGLINRLVDGMVADNQFDECDITLRDVQCVKESFNKILLGVFHHRIDYPGYDFKQIGEETKEPSV
jgi:putative nucleotidyltransferase with HDIG domain